MSIRARKPNNVVRPGQGLRTDGRARVATQRDVASLSSTTVGEMTDAELVRTIKVARLQALTSECVSRLPDFDHAALVQLTHLAVFTCRNREKASIRKPR
mgnify:CR=1 FL=1